MSKRSLIRATCALLSALVIAQTTADPSLAHPDEGGATEFSAPRLATYDSDRAGEEPPGHDGRITHQTLLRTTETDCDEISIWRAGDPTELRSRVPADYALGPARVFINDYVCRELSVDGQALAKETIVSFGHVSVTHRKGQPAPGAGYLLWLATDNPALAARYRQVGVAAIFAPDSWSSTTTTTDEGVKTTIVLDASGLTHRLTTVTPVAPSPQPPTAPSGLTLYHQGWNGEVRLDYRNTDIAAVSAKVAGDLSTASNIAPLIAAPNLLKLSGISTFSNAAIRGDWSGTLQRIE